MNQAESDTVLRRLRALAADLERVGIDRETIAAAAVGWGTAEAVALFHAKPLAAMLRRTADRLEAGELERERFLADQALASAPAAGRA